MSDGRSSSQYEVADNHPITPKRGTMRVAATGLPTDGMNPLEYPLTGECLGCGQPIRIIRYVLAEWTHVDQAGIELSGRLLR